MSTVVHRALQHCAFPAFAEREPGLSGAAECHLWITGTVRFARRLKGQGVWSENRELSQNALLGSAQWRFYRADKSQLAIVESAAFDRIAFA